MATGGFGGFEVVLGGFGGFGWFWVILKWFQVGLVVLGDFEVAPINRSHSHKDSQGCETSDIGVDDAMM